MYFLILVGFILTYLGESGEVCEIFQWKGELEAYFVKNRDGTLPFTEREIVHIGEEIADVFIYSTRLSDVCGIDLAHAVESLVKNIEVVEEGPPLLEYFPSFKVRRVAPASDEPWIVIKFAAYENVDVFKANNYRSHRHLALALQNHVGKLSYLFSKYPEANSCNGLLSWSELDINQLGYSLACICSLLITLAKMSKLTIGEIIADKFEKNASKYPVALAKNSSAKYTAYLQDDELKDKYNIVITFCVACIVAFCVGKYFR